MRSDNAETANAPTVAEIPSQPTHGLGIVVTDLGQIERHEDPANHEVGDQQNAEERADQHITLGQRLAQRPARNPAVVLAARRRGLANQPPHEQSGHDSWHTRKIERVSPAERSCKCDQQDGRDE
jgi:hypothetical protein